MYIITTSLMTKQMIRQHFGWSKVVMKVNVTFLTLASMPVYVVQIRVCFSLNYSNKFWLNVLMDTMNKFLNKCIWYDLQSIHFCIDIVEQVHICRTVTNLHTGKFANATLLYTFIPSLPCIEIILIFCS